jgi:hypothetical protein
MEREITRAAYEAAKTRWKNLELSRESAGWSLSQAINTLRGWRVTHGKPQLPSKHPPEDKADWLVRVQAMLSQETDDAWQAEIAKRWRSADVAYEAACTAINDYLDGPSGDLYPPRDDGANVHTSFQFADMLGDYRRKIEELDTLAGGKTIWDESHSDTAAELRIIVDVAERLKILHEPIPGAPTLRFAYEFAQRLWTSAIAAMTTKHNVTTTKRQRRNEQDYIKEAGAFLMKWNKVDPPKFEDLAAQLNVSYDTVARQYRKSERFKSIWDSGYRRGTIETNEENKQARGIKDRVNGDRYRQRRLQDD